VPTSKTRRLSNRTCEAVPKSSTVPPQPHSGQSFSTSIDDNPSASKKRKVHHHAPLDARDASNPKSPHRISSSSATLEASALPVDPDDPFTLEYDLDRDPTQEVYKFHQFHERSYISAILSARFIHSHLLEGLLGLTMFNDEPTGSEGGFMTEFIGPAAMSSVGPYDEIIPSYALDSAGVLENPHPSPGYGLLGLDGVAHVTGPFADTKMGDVFSHHQWEPDAGAMIDPSLLGGTPAFSEPRPPSPASTQFRDFHSWRGRRTPSPPLTQSALTIFIPPHTSTSDSNSARNPRDSRGSLGGGGGGGKAKFYKNGALQNPPHLSNSQSRRSMSAHASRRPSLEESLEIDSPLTELSVSGLLTSGTASTSSLATPSEAANTADEDATDIGTRSGTPPPRVHSVKTSTSQGQKGSTNREGPYRIVAVNANTYCHQCRRNTPHPKMCCRTCPKLFCILCIVKRCAPPC
jgi:hypothetical protein